MITSPPLANLRSLAALVTALLCASCGSRATPAGDGSTLADSRSPGRDYRESDAARRLDTSPVLSDVASLPVDYGLCQPCKSGEVYLMSGCVATDKLWTCAPGCDPNATNPCGAGQRCDPWGGPPCCVCSAIVPACVPAYQGGPLVGPLRINPTEGQAGQKVTITITGAPFNVGALYYHARLGSQVAPMVDMKACSLAADFTPANPGIYPVEVSQYGGGTPWVLAGFFTATAGSTPMPTTQPGYPCSMNPQPGDPACASAAPYSCSCVAGRCACK